MNRAFSRLGRATPVLLSGAYAEAVTVGFGEEVPSLLGALAWVCLGIGVALRGRFAVSFAVYGFGGLTLAALFLRTPPTAEANPAFQFLGWLAFALAWGTLSESPAALPESAPASGPPVMELVSEGHAPIRRGGTGMGILVAVTAGAAIVAPFVGPEPTTVEHRILSRVVFVGLGALLLALAGECAGCALELKAGADRRVRRTQLLVALALWFVGTLGLLGAAERLSHQAFGMAFLGALASGTAAGLGLRSVRSAREN